MKETGAGGEMGQASKGGGVQREYRHVVCIAEWQFMCCLYVLIFIFPSSFCQITIVILVSALGVHVACTCRMQIHVSLSSD